MADTLSQIDKQDKIINTDFIITQIKVHNPSQYPLYINFSGKKPTNIVYDLLVQPHSDVTSPKIDTRIITTYTSIIDLNAVPTITSYSSLQTAPANMPFISAQNIGSLPGYPFTASGAFVSLPPIQIDTFKTVYFLVNGSFGNPCIITGSSKVIGKLDSGNGIITFTPVTLNTLQAFEILGAISSFWVINAIQSDGYIFLNNLQTTFATSFGSSPATYSNFFTANQPASMLSIYINDSIGASFAYNVDIKIFINPDGTSNSKLVFNRNFTGTMPVPPINYIVKDLFLPITENANFIEIQIIDNTGLSNSVAYVIDKWNFVP